MIRILIFVSIILPGLFYGKSSFAFDKFGHQVVCQLAFDHLALAKQQRITQYLNAVPKKQQVLINQYNGLSKDDVLTFANACTWADAIKNQAGYEQYKSWHYINVPRTLTQIKKPLCSRNCIPQAIITHQQQLQSSPRSWQSAQALMFVGHWLGDIHQPLHVSYASDRGGNKVRLYDTQSQCKNLHAYWDSCLLKTSKRTKSQWIEKLSGQWSSMYVANFYSQQVWEWANESYQMVRSPTFKYCQLNNQKSCLTIQDKLTLKRSYPREHLPKMEKQILKAAKRLKRILEISL